MKLIGNLGSLFENPQATTSITLSFPQPCVLLLFFFRILELGFGKEIEEILDVFGSRLNRSNGQISVTSTDSEFPRQNLLLSATLNEKVNHLAKISLENPVMIGIDERKLHQNSSSKQFGSLGSDEEDEAEHSGRAVDSSSGDYNLPSQLIQKYVKGICELKVNYYASRSQLSTQQTQ